ncbi:MAG: hypothetical protein SGARI_008014 [Bacillariaceae sp.]
MPDGLYILSAKHNFNTDRNIGGIIVECQLVHVVNPQNGSPLPLKSDIVKREMEVDLSAVAKNDPNGFPLRDGETWKYGCDIVKIPLADEPKISRLVDLAFDVVSQDFEIKPGMKVGLIACSASGNVLLASEIKMNYVNMKDYVEKMLDTFVPVGEITYVGEDHVEYRMNTFPGMSGSAVFIISNDDQHMKLIAIHAGYLAAFGSNFGFKVTV